MMQSMIRLVLLCGSVAASLKCSLHDIDVTALLQNDISIAAQLLESDSPADSEHLPAEVADRHGSHHSVIGVWVAHAYEAGLAFLAEEQHARLDGPAGGLGLPAGGGLARAFSAAPVVALALGLLLMKGPRAGALLGKALVFFGAQTFMNLYMKLVLSSAPVDAARGLRGFPAAFAVTGLQMATSFVLFLVAFVVLWPTPWRYRPKVLKSRKELLTIALFSVTFTLNIALNNFSLALLPISLNLLIRSATPLATLVAQQTASRAFGETPRESRLAELGLMCVSVGCVVVAVVAKVACLPPECVGPQEEPHLLLGVVVCICSLLAVAVNVVFAGMLGSSMSLNPLDTVFYMSVPSFLCLLLPTFFISHVSNWPIGSMTDWDILKIVAERSPGTVGLALLSGAFTLVYSALQCFVVQTLPATHVTIVGSFNKVATVALSVLIGLERLPQGRRGVFFVLGVVGNIIGFTWHSVIKAASIDMRLKDKKGARS